MVTFSGKQTTSRTPLTLLLYSAGLLASIYLLQIQGGSDSKFCELLGSCSDVLSSGYGYILGMPVASFSLAYFSFQIAFLVFSRRNKVTTGKKTIYLPLLLNLVALATSLYFLYIMAFSLHEYCFFCLIVHSVNILIMVVNAATSHSKSMHCLQPVSPTTNTNTSAVLLIPLFISSTLFFGANYLNTHKQLMHERQNVQGNLEYAIFKYQQASKYSFKNTRYDIVIGNPEIASHQVVLIFKEGCQHCQQARTALTKLVKSNETAIYLVLKNYKNFSQKRLKEIKVKHVPAVFINGQRAEGWQLPGFMEFFAEDCGC